MEPLANVALAIKMLASAADFFKTDVRTTQVNRDGP